MFNVEIKKLLPFLAIPLMLLSAACGKSDESRAKNLYSQAETLANDGKYSEALILLDSMDRSCASAVDMRRKGMSLRPKLIEQVASRQLEVADSIAAIDSYRLDTLSGQIQLVPNEIENYFVPKAEGHVNVGTESGLHGRMSPDGRIYLIATSPKPIKTVSISVISGNESVSTPSVGYDGERNDRSSGKDVITFIEGECQEVVEFIYLHKDKPLTATFSGDESVSMAITENQKKGIASLFEISRLVRERKKQELEKQRLEKTLAVARSQIARTLITDSIDVN